MLRFVERTVSRQLFVCPGLELPRFNRGSHLFHEPLIEGEIVKGQEDGALDFSVLEEVTHGGTCIVLAAGTFAARLHGDVTVCMHAVSHAHRPVFRKGKSITPVARG